MSIALHEYELPQKTHTELINMRKEDIFIHVIPDRMGVVIHKWLNLGYTVGTCIASGGMGMSESQYFQTTAGELGQIFGSIVHYVKLMALK